MSGDDGEGLYYFGKRYYDAEIGLFTSTDPDKQFFNSYTYGPNNPIRGVDIDGRYWIQEHYIYAQGALTGAVDRTSPVDMYFTLEDRNYLEYLVLGAAKDQSQSFAISKIPVLGNILEKAFGVFSLFSQAKEMKTLKNNSQKLFDARMLPEGKRFKTWDAADKTAQNIYQKKNTYKWRIGALRKSKIDQLLTQADNMRKIILVFLVVT